VYSNLLKWQSFFLEDMDASVFWLIPWIRVLLEEVFAIWIFKNLQSLQEPTTGPYPLPDESISFCQISLLSYWFWRLFPKGKNGSSVKLHLPPTSAEVKKTWICTSTPL
jgi:hypothetical protein